MTTAEPVRVGLAVIGGAVAGVALGYASTMTIGIIFGYVVGDDGGPEAKLTAWLPALALAAAALALSGRTRRAFLVGAVVGWVVGGLLALLEGRGMD